MLNKERLFSILLYLRVVLKIGLNITLLLVVLVLGNCLLAKAGSGIYKNKLPSVNITKSACHSWTDGIDLVFNEDDEVDTNYRFKIKNQHRRLFAAFKTSRVSEASILFSIAGFYTHHPVSINKNSFNPCQKCPVYLSYSNFRI